MLYQKPKVFLKKMEERHNTCSKFKPAILLEYEIIHEAPKTGSQSSQIKILGEQSLNLGWYENYIVFLVLGGYLILLITTSPSFKNISQLGNQWFQFFWKNQSWKIIFSDYLKNLNTPMVHKRMDKWNWLFYRRVLKQIRCFEHEGFLSEQVLSFLENSDYQPWEPAW